MKLVIADISCAMQTVSCESESEDLASDVSKALGQQAEQVLVVCASASFTSASASPATPLDLELEQLLAVQEAVDASELGHVVIYMSQKKTMAPRERRLADTAMPPPSPPQGAAPALIGFGPYTTCGKLCQVIASPVVLNPAAHHG